MNKILSQLLLVLLVSGCTTVDKMILGMPLARSITPEFVGKYKTPQELINGEKLNGDDKYSVAYGKIYSSNLNQIIIPFKYLSSLCISQNGKFSPISTKSSPYIGTFECSKLQKNWYVNIENTRTDGDDVYLRTDVASDFHVSIMRSIEKDKIAERQDLVRKQNEQKIIKEKQYEKYITKNAPKHTDIGLTICKESQLSVYTGIMVLGNPSFKSVSGRVIANLESFPASSKNLKINIRGFLNSDNNIGSGSDVFYKQTPLESGRVIWDESKGWYKCSY